jgi:hypothetical protein
MENNISDKLMCPICGESICFLGNGKWTCWNKLCRNSSEELDISEAADATEYSCVCGNTYIGGDCPRCGRVTMVDVTCTIV